MRGQYILDLKFMAIRKIEEEYSVDVHMALYDSLIKFIDSSILRREDDQFLCDIGSFVRFCDLETRVAALDATNNKIMFTDALIEDYEYDVKKLELIGFTVYNEPILEYNF